MSPLAASSHGEGKDSHVGVVIAAAGASRRMVTGDKIFEPLLGKPLIAHTISVFEACPLVDEIVLVLGEHSLAKGRRLVTQEGWMKVKEVCPGGARRQDSVKAGLQRLSPCRWVMVHDGARPCVTQDIIHRGLEQAALTDAAVPAVAVNDTVKRVRPDGVVLETPHREGLWAVQTPQVFGYNLLQEAYQGSLDDVTDDASLVERLGHEVATFPGSPENIKVTTRADLKLAEAILKSRAVP